MVSTRISIFPDKKMKSVT